MYIEQLDENIPGAPTYLKSLDSGKTTLLHDCAAPRNRNAHLVFFIAYHFADIGQKEKILRFDL
jgi:hypothetical protein